MTLDADDIKRILTAADTIKESLGVLADYQEMSRGTYHDDRIARDVVGLRPCCDQQSAQSIRTFWSSCESGENKYL